MGELRAVEPLRKEKETKRIFKRKAFYRMCSVGSTRQMLALREIGCMNR